MAADAMDGCSATLTMNRLESLKWNGWGYKDSKFIVNKDGNVEFTGSRYEHSGMVLPMFNHWIVNKFHVDITEEPDISELDLSNILPQVRNEEFLKEINKSGIKISDDVEQRVFRAHGHTLQDMWRIRKGLMKRIPDIVVWPERDEDVEKVVKLAVIHNVVIIPYGGGTNVTLALFCSEEEKRMIVSLDTCLMNKILWIDEENLAVRVQAGMVGQDLERELSKRGYCVGHEPDSIEFSTVGGWISTRASGMKKNTYGNIEDLLVHVTMITPSGVLQKSSLSPRMSTGPDIHSIVLGSEGTLGVITSATLKIRPLPEFKRYGSIAFPDFESGVRCLREIAKRRCAPASIRLVDNEQFLFGQALKAGPSSWIHSLVGGLKKLYITRMKGFDINEMCAATLLFEGTAAEVDAQERLIYKIAKQYGGLPGGEDNGRIGYRLTFMIAYLRDIALDYHVVGESFETSVPWDKVMTLCTNTKERIKSECEANGVKYPCWVSCRVTQTYDAGACVYFYFAFNYKGLSDPIHTYELVESAARDEVLACGGSLSHHHGVGKIRKRWMPIVIGQQGLDILKSIKQCIDPKNIFAANNIVNGETLKAKL